MVCNIFQLVRKYRLVGLLGADKLCDKVIGLEVLADKVLGASWDPHYVRDGNKEGRKAGEHRDTSYCSSHPSIVIGQMAE